MDANTKNETLRFVKVEPEGILHSKSGFTISREGQAVSDYAEYTPELITPYLCLTMRDFRFMNSLEYESSGSSAHEDDSSSDDSLQHSQNRAITGVASTKRSDEEWLSDRFIIAGEKIYRDITSLEVSILSSEYDKPTIAIGFLEPDPEMPIRGRESAHVFAEVTIPKQHFDIIWNDLKSKTTSGVSLRLVFRADFPNLFLDFDPLGGQPREILIIQSTRHIENADEIPEEFLTRHGLSEYMFGGRLTLPLRIDVVESSFTTPYSLQPDNEKSPDAEHEAVWARGPHDLDEQSAVLTTQYLTLARKIERVDRGSALAIFVAFTALVVHFFI